MGDGLWVSAKCKSARRFICASQLNTLRGITNNTLKFTKDQLPFPQINVWYNYTFTNRSLLDSWKNKKMTGFRLNWFILDEDGKYVLERMDDLPGDWKPKGAIPTYQEPFLIQMVQLVSRARDQNISREEVIDKFVKKKANLIKTGFLQYTTMCSGGRVKEENNKDIFSEILTNLDIESRQVDVTEEDIKSGFLIFSSIVHCSESVALTQFLHSLLSTQSPRTIIQATVNTIQSEGIAEDMNRKKFNEFFLALDKIFHFQLGKILLAISSPSQLQTMRDKDLPYFTHYSQDLDQCLNGASCLGVTDLVNTLGNIYNSKLPFHLLTLIYLYLYFVVSLEYLGK